MNRLTASKLELAKACPGAFGLVWRDDREKYAAVGTANHAAYEKRILEGDIPEALSSTFPGVTQWFAETKLAYNVATRTARVLGHGNDRDYTKADDPFDLTGTCDVYGIDGDAVVAVDWKLRSFVAARDSYQLKFYALALCKALGKSVAKLAIFPEIGAPSLATFDLFDFDSFETELHQIYLRASSPPKEYNVGSQCRYCPGFLNCEKTTQELALVTTGATPAHVELSLPLETDDEASRFYLLFQRVDALAKRMRSAVYARAAERPIPLPDGMQLAQRAVKGNRQIDADKAYDVIREKYGQKIADAAVTRETSQVAIEAALKAGGIASPKPTKDALVAQLEKSGGVTRKDSTTVDIHVATRPMLKAMP